MSFDGAMFSDGAVSFGGATFSDGRVFFVGATFSGGTVAFRDATGPAPSGLLTAVGTPTSVSVILPPAWLTSNP